MGFRLSDQECFHVKPGYVSKNLGMQWCPGTTVLTSSQMPPTTQGSEEGLATVRLVLPSALAFECVNAHVNSPELSGTRAALAVVSSSNFEVLAKPFLFRSVLAGKGVSECIISLHFTCGRLVVTQQSSPCEWGCESLSGAGIEIKSLPHRASKNTWILRPQ